MFTPQAGVDIESACRWYENRRQGLGEEFRSSLDIICQLLVKFPAAGPVAHREVRRILLPRFPYALYYRVVGDAIEVRACLHQYRGSAAVTGARKTGHA